MTNVVKSGFAALTLAILAACGGGGGGTSGGASAPASTPPPAGTQTVLTVAASVQALAGQTDALFSGAGPTTSAQSQSLNDGCFLNNGFTKALNIANVDADIPQFLASNAFRIGSTRTNVRVITVYNEVNPEGSSRTIADVLYDINYTDGSKDKDAKNVMVSGSTSGLCATSQSSAEWRFLGNQEIVGFNVQARNIRNEQRNKTTGDLLQAAALYTNALQFNVTDPRGLATYAVVTGPGTTTISGVATPFSIKLLSTKVLREDPLLVGKRSNFTNWTANDSFRICRIPSTAFQVPASAADCVNNTSGNLRGTDLPVPATGGVPASAITFFDSAFANLGFVVGGEYTVKIYNDDGWKTVNGQAGKTPIATYTAVNDSLPYTFLQMVGTVDLEDHRFAKLLTNSLTTFSAAAAAISSSTPSTFAITWSAPQQPNDGRAFRFTEVGEFFQGVKTGIAPGAFNPAERYYKPTYFTGNTTSAPALAITPAPSTIQNKSYAEFSLNYTDRNSGRIISTISFQ